MVNKKMTYNVVISVNLYLSISFMLGGEESLKFTWNV